MITEVQIITRILVAAFLALLVGVERERRNQDAGLRTHMILVIGAALAMPVSINLAIQYHPDAPTGDPARLAAQVVSGIGFLGAGVIFRTGASVRGLTTAVSLWSMAMVGLAVGGGYFLTGAVVTGLLLAILTILDYIEDHYIASIARMHITVWADDRPGLLAELREVLHLKPQNMERVTIEKDTEAASVIYHVGLFLWKEKTSEAIVDDVSAIEGVRKVKIEN